MESVGSDSTAPLPPARGGGGDASQGPAVAAAGAGSLGTRGASPPRSKLAPTASPEYPWWITLVVGGGVLLAAAGVVTALALAGWKAAPSSSPAPTDAAAAATVALAERSVAAAAAGGAAHPNVASVAAAPYVATRYDEFGTVLQTDVVVGTSPLRVVLDSGSAYLVAALAGCAGCPPSQTRYDPGDSPTAQREPGVTNQRVQYGSQTDVMDGYRDTLVVRTGGAAGGGPPPGALVAPATRVAGIVSNSGTTASNILGLSPLREGGAHAAAGAPFVSPVLAALEAGGLGPTLHFSFPPGGVAAARAAPPRLALGAGADPAPPGARRWMACVPALPYATSPLAAARGAYYVLRCTGLVWVPAGGAPMPLPHPAHMLIDTGTTLLLLPTAVAAAAAAAVYRDATPADGRGAVGSVPRAGELRLTLAGRHGASVTLAYSGGGLLFHAGTPLLSGYDDSVYSGGAAGTPAAGVPSASGVGIWGLHAMRGLGVSLDAGGLRVGIVPHGATLPRQ